MAERVLKGHSCVLLGKGAPGDYSQKSFLKKEAYKLSNFSMNDSTYFFQQHAWLYKSVLHQTSFFFTRHSRESHRLKSENIIIMRC